MKRLAIVTTHPIQYNAPLFELLTRRNVIEIKVFYTWGETVLKEKYDPGFEQVIGWDIPLLKGYNYEFLVNTSNYKGSYHFKGIINPNIINSVKNYQPDAILVYGWAFKSHLKVLRYFKHKIPILFRGDSTLLDKKSFIFSLKRKFFLRWIYRYVDIALYVGKNNYDYFRKGGLKKSQLVFAPHAIDNKRFECTSIECKNEEANLRKSLNIATEDFVFLFAGKFTPKKDPEILARAFTTLNFGKSVHLVMVGNGVLEEKLKLDYFNSRNVHFVNFQNQLQMPSVYELADVFILPSLGPGESWGLSVNEAMANRKVIIVSSKCGCAADLVENAINGFTFMAGNVIDLQNKMMETYNCRNELGNLKDNSYKKIESFSLEILAQTIERVVCNISK